MPDGISRTGAICHLCSETEETLEHFLYECTELRHERENAERKTGVFLPRKREAEAFVLEADLKESLLIHRLYTDRSPNPELNDLVEPILASCDQ